jgi:hypothetical protein
MSVPSLITTEYLLGQSGIPSFGRTKISEIGTRSTSLVKFVGYSLASLFWQSLIQTGLSMTFSEFPSLSSGSYPQNPRPNAPSGYWDHPVNQVSREDAEMHFLGYFDWNQLDYLDFRYYHVQIARCDAYAELVGREALVDRQQATVYMENE